jgi:hypothetical protein
MAAEERKGMIHAREFVKIEHGFGFIAFYQGEEIAFAKDFGVLLRKSPVKERIGSWDLIIKHNVPKGMIYVY